MRLNRLLIGLMGAGGVWLAPTAAGARLQHWQFDPDLNRLTFTTDGEVRPQPRLVSPTRLVIDLPGVVYDQAAAQHPGGAVRSIQVSRRAHATRLELELSRPPGSQNIQVWGITPQRWVVQLPDGDASHGTGPLPPSLKTAATDHPPELPSFAARLAPKQVTTAYQSAATQLQGIVATPQGFFIQTSGANPQVQVYRTRDRNSTPQLVIDLTNAALGPGVRVPPPHLGIRHWSITPFATQPPSIRLILTLTPQNSQWQVTPLGQGGLVLIPSPAAQPVVSVAQPVSQPAAPSLAQAGRVVIALDPGHGGADPGAVGIGGLQEKVVVTAITRHVAAALEAAGYGVVLTRRGDQEVDLLPRVEVAEAAQARLFVSIHANAISMDRPEVNGVETYYYSDLGRQLAQVVHAQILQRVVMGDRGVRQARFFVLRRSSMPAVLIETGFVTGAVDAPQLANPQWQAQMGQAIAAGIITYLQQP